jgi:hypothetical protein
VEQAAVADRERLDLAIGPLWVDVSQDLHRFLFSAPFHPPNQAVAAASE